MWHTKLGSRLGNIFEWLLWSKHGVYVFVEILVCGCFYALCYKKLAGEICVCVMSQQARKFKKVQAKKTREIK